MHFTLLLFSFKLFTFQVLYISCHLHIAFTLCLYFMLLSFVFSLIFKKTKNTIKMAKTLKRFIWCLRTLCYYPLLEEYFGPWTLELRAFLCLKCFIWYIVTHLIHRDLSETLWFIWCFGFHLRLWTSSASFKDSSA